MLFIFYKPYYISEQAVICIGPKHRSHSYINIVYIVIFLVDIYIYIWIWWVIYIIAFLHYKIPRFLIEKHIFSSRVLGFNTLCRGCLSHVQNTSFIHLYLREGKLEKDCTSFMFCQLRAWIFVKRASIMSQSNYVV